MKNYMIKSVKCLYRLFLDLDDKDKFILLLKEPYRSIAKEVGSFVSNAMLERDKALTAQCQAWNLISSLF